MKPVDQTVFGFPGGNCFAACVASLLELPIDAVPNFCSDPGDWFLGFRHWLAERGWGAGMFDWQLLGEAGQRIFGQGVLVIAGGKSPRGNDHAVLWRSGQVQWDPHPDRSGITTLEDVTILFPLDASEFIRGERVAMGARAQGSQP